MRIGRLNLILLIFFSATIPASAQPDFSATRPQVEQRILDPLPTAQPEPPMGVRARANNPIDQFIAANWAKYRVIPHALCSENEFVRRAYLDITGVIPTVDQVTAYLESSTTNRRPNLIDELLASPRYADHWTAFWGDLLREQSYVQGVEVNSFRRYIRQSLHHNKRYDQWVWEMITATGMAKDNPAANFILRDRGNDENLTIATTQVFLGTQLKCAQCHDHPFDVWEQRDFNDMQKFWSGTRTPVGRQEKVGDENSMRTIPFFAVVGGTNSSSRFFTDERPDAGYAGRVALADWIVRPQNPYFARVAVNRLWAELMGRGLVDPPDGFSVLNPASHPALLDWLAIEFINSDYDLKHILRLILNSRTYQLSSVDTGVKRAPVPEKAILDGEVIKDLTGNYLDAETGLPIVLFDAMPIRRMTAEQLHDSILISTGLYQLNPERYTPAVERRYPDNNGFLGLFGSPDREIIQARQTEATIPQALELLNGWFINYGVALHEENPIKRWIVQGVDGPEILRRLYLHTLSREPMRSEVRTVKRYIGDGRQPERWSDVHWALINTREFMFIK